MVKRLIKPAKQPDTLFHLFRSINFRAYETLVVLILIRTWLSFVKVTITDEVETWTGTETEFQKGQAKGKIEAINGLIKEVDDLRRKISETD